MNNSISSIHCDIAGQGKFFIDGDGHGHPFKLLDISTEGILVIAPNPAPVDSEVKLEIHLSSYPTEVRIRSNGKVIQTIPADSSHEIKIEFLDMDYHDKEFLKEIIINTCDLE